MGDRSPTEGLRLDAARFARVEALFLAALDLPAAERAAFLEDQLAGSTGDDASVPAETPDIVAEVEAMLIAADELERGDRQLEEIVAAGGDLLPTDLAEVVSPLGGAHPSEDAPSPSRQPERIGPYRVLEEIGRGGLATVYLAERDDDEFSRRVALKLIRRGLDTQPLLERLRLERQILALLDHPHIARLYDGGTSKDGRPYFVMEAIEGERLDLWCQNRRLPLKERLELFRKVCGAVHFAHQNLVLHRDLKPSNILVGQDGEPKLLDFGIAKLLEPEAFGDPGTESKAEPLVGDPALTETGMRLLTPEFASPEQVRGETLSTASDIYSLGVLLFVLTAGQRPYALDRRRPAEVERIVCEQEAPKPSTVARQNPETAAPAWRPGRQGDDLDNVILMALRKDPARRYISAAALAEDVRRYLHLEPVQARPDTLIYRSSRFVRRYWLGVSATLFLIVTLAGAAAITTWQASLARQERERAEARSLEAETTANFLTRLFEVSDPFGDSYQEVTARQLLEAGAREIRTSLEQTPETRARLLIVLSEAFRNISLYPRAFEMQRTALEILDEHRGSRHPDTLAAKRQLAIIQLEMSDLEAAETLLTTALTQQKEELGDGDPEIATTHFWLGQVALRRERFATAEEFFQRAYDLRSRRLGEEDVETATALRGIGEARLAAGDSEGAEAIFERALKSVRRHYGPHHLEVATLLNNLAVSRKQSGRVEEAITLYEEVIQIRQARLGDGHMDTAFAIYHLASARQSLGQLEKAATLAEEALAIQQRLLSGDHHHKGRSLALLGLIYHGLGRLAEARGAYEKVSAMRRRLHGEDHVSVARIDYRLGELALEDGDLELAEESYRRSARIYGVQKEESARAIGRYPLTRLGEVLIEGGQAQKAKTPLEEALKWAEDPAERGKIEDLLAASAASP